MHLYNHIYQDDVSLIQFISTNKIQSSENILIQIFSGTIDKQVIAPLTKFLKETLPQSKIIGTTTSGEIVNSKMLQNTLTLSFSVFDNVKLRSMLCDFNTRFDISAIKKELVFTDTKALVIFSDGLKSTMEPFLRELHTLVPDVLIAGGQAGDNDKFEQTYVFDERQIIDNGCVIASLSGEDLIVNNEYIFNWTPIGKEMYVTKCDGHILYELDNTPILEVYKKYLGKDIISDLPASCMAFPLIMSRDGISIARDPISYKGDEALTYAGEFKVGDSVRFSFANIEDLTDNIQEDFKELVKYPSEAVYVYSCAARKALLEQKLEDELGLLESLAPSVGFFTYGEFFQSAHMAELLNVTTTFLTLSESSKRVEKKLKKFSSPDFDPIRKALTHLVKVTTVELEDSSTHDSLTSLFNRAEYTKVIQQKITYIERYKGGFGLILLDIDFFKNVNDNFGHQVGDDVLVSLSKLLLLNTRENDFVARWGGEEFIIIVNNVDFTALEILINKLQKSIAINDFPSVGSITVSFGFSVYKDGDTDDELFHRVDNALYLAKKNGRNCYEKA
ncbi:diguanylate cyclase [Sulfurimonas sp. SAG-AH-194-C21]|nr:diguanylate cyclase [Sulfurimonas sp. SAG-AH-194-C21]MDF1883892.1 diguanylate cyclase [Sulfurimonas sp. SAG-AH-194-C21]